MTLKRGTNIHRNAGKYLAIDKAQHHRRLGGVSPQDLDLNPCITINLQIGGEKWESSARDSNKVLPDRKRGDMTIRHSLCHKRQQKGNAEDVPDVYYETLL